MATVSATLKSKVRKSKAWQEFRKKLIAEQKTDPITGKKLMKCANVHHMDLNIEHYSNLDPDHFVVLNRQSHQLIHMIFRR